MAKRHVQDGFAQAVRGGGSRRVWLRTATLAVLLVSLLSGCERGAVHPALREAQLPALVPAHRFVFGRSELDGFRFSPDGERLAWNGPHRFGRALHVRNPDGKVHVYRVGGSSTYWSADGRRLLILDDKSGQENHHLYRLDVEDPDATPHDLTPWPGVRVWLYQIPESDPEHVLVLHNRRDRNLRDLYRINLSTGAEKLVAANPGDGIVPVTDAAGAFLGWRRPKDAIRARGKPRPPELKERSALSRKSEDHLRTVGISTDGRTAWVLTNQGRDRVALYEVDTASRRGRLVHEDADADVSRVVTSPRTGKPLLVGTHADYPRMRILDEGLAVALAPILERYRGTRFGFDISSMDRSEQKLVVTVYTHASRHYYLLDRSRGTHTRLDKGNHGDFETLLTVPEAMRFRARDGMEIPAYLVRPRVSGTRPLPLVVLVHGGPWQRVVWSDFGHNEDLLRAHFLANRGYAVLLVNFRGSVGYGRSFALAAVGEMGARMQDDLVDGVEWAIQAGIADPARIAVMGHSYGGYASLMALAREPQRFACGIDIAGPTDLPALIESFPPYWEVELDHWYSYVGDPAVPADRARMEAASPINWAHRIERPLLILHGRNDVRVRIEQSERMADALRRAGKPVRFVRIPEMGHSTGYWAHHLLVLREAEAFLADCLGGRAARFDLLEWAARLTGRLPLGDPGEGP